MILKNCNNPECKQKNPQPIENFHADNRRKDGHRSRCKSCELEAAKAYRDAHKEERARKQREYYQTHGDVQRQASNNWKQNNREHTREYMKKWYEQNKEVRTEYNKKYAEENHEGVLERSRKRRAITHGLDDFFTEEEFFKKFEEYGKVCFYCKKELAKGTVTRDHYIPLTKGGTDSIDNIVPCCRNCNSKKRNKLPEEFMKELTDNHEPSRTNGKK